MEYGFGKLIVRRLNINMKNTDYLFSYLFSYTRVSLEDRYVKYKSFA